MNKPFSVVYEEFKQNMASLINNCGLPPSVIESLLQNYLSEVTSIAKNQYASDKAQYEKFLNEKNTSENNKEVETKQE